MFTIKQMRYFEALATSLHFGKAAALVNVSQPALSMQIAEMESLTGHALFERLNRKIMLTSHGQALLPVIRDILSRVDSLKMLVDRDRDALTHPVKLGIIPTLAPYILPRLIELQRQLHPRLVLELHEATTQQLAIMIEAGQCDCVLAARPFPLVKYEATAVFTDPFYLAVNQAQASTLPQQINPEDIDPSQLLLLQEGHCLRDQALNICQRTSQEHLSGYGATSLQTLLQFVANGYGMTLIPAIALPMAHSIGNIKIVEFKDRAPSRDICLFWREKNYRSSEFHLLAATITQCAESLLAENNQNIPISHLS